MRYQGPVKNIPNGSICHNRGNCIFVVIDMNQSKILHTYVGFWTVGQICPIGDYAESIVDIDILSSEEADLLKLELL